MSTVEFLGTYAARGDYRLPTLPVENESGLWQAWRTPEGDYVVQPLDYNREPWGSHSIMAAGDFEDTLFPLPSDEAIGSAGRGLFRADSPDLLDYWYEQAVSSSPGDEGLLPGSALGMQKQTTSAASDDVAETEPQFAPLGEPAFHELPDIILEDPLTDEKAVSPKPAVPPSLPEPPFHLEVEPPATSGPAEQWLAAVDKAGGSARLTESPGVSAPPAPSFSKATLPASSFPLPGNTASPEEEAQDRAMMQENLMYSEFNKLALQLDEGSHPGVEAAIENLLKKGTGFTWRQKFMFSEFGMTLRRKKKFRLALQSHRRALALAPKDEHVLFNVARSEYDLGNVEAAREYLKKALESDPGFQLAQNFLGFLTTGR